MPRLRRRTLAVTAAILCAALFGVAVRHFWPAAPADRTARPELAPPAPARDRVAEAPSQNPPGGGRSPRGDVFPYNRVVAVTVGIDTYPNVFPPRNLSKAVADAVAIGDTFRDVFGYEVVPLHGPAATRTGILEAVERYGRELGSRDALIIYFAGHGQTVELPSAGEAGFLVPVEAKLDIQNRTDVDRWREQAIDMRSLVALANQASAGHVLIIADACCSGHLTSSRGALSRHDLKNFLFDRSRAVLTSTTRYQAAKDGRFTAKLVERLRRLDPPDRKKEVLAASVYDLAFGLILPVPGKGEEVVFTGLLHEVAEGSKEMTPQAAQVGDGDGLFVFVPAAADRRELEKDLRDLQSGGPGSRLLRPVIDRRRAALEQFTKPAEVYALLEAPDYRLGTDPEDRQREWEQRLERFRRNALSGDGWAMAALCLCYERGLGVKPDAAEAYFWARRADHTEQPAGAGRFLLGRCYEHSLGVSAVGQVAREQARRLYTESANAGFGPGRWAAARIMLSASPSTAQAEAAKGLLEQAAADGVPGAEVDLAMMLLEGTGGLKADVPEALKLLEGAAKRANARAHLELYRAFTQARPGYPPTDRGRAEEHLRRAADLGLADALFALGSEYDGFAKSLGLRRDPRQAFLAFDQAAQRGHPVSLVVTAKMLTTGVGTPLDHDMARARLEKALRLGCPQADNLQAQWYLDGKLYRQNDELALQAFLRGADKGDNLCRLGAGAMILDGLGLKVANAHKDGRFHDQWHRGLHLFTAAIMSGALNKKDSAWAGGALDDFRDHLEGGKFSKELDRDLQRLGRDVLDHIHEGSPKRSGGRGERRVVRLMDKDLQVHIVYGNLIVKAAANAESWRRSHPDTFHFFCENWGVDPKTLEAKESKPRPASKD